MYKVTEREYQDMKTHLDEFFNAITGLPASESNLQLIRMKKQQFLDWLKEYNLDYLLQTTEDFKSRFEWDCLYQIQTYIRHFDEFMLECIEVASLGAEELYYRDERLKRKMEAFDKEIVNG